MSIEGQAMTDTKDLKRILAELEAARAQALSTLVPDRLDDSDLERLARTQLAIQAIREVIEGDRKDRDFEEWLRRADEE